MPTSNTEKLESFLKSQLPHVRYATPDSPDFASLRESFLLSNEAVPLAIARPQNGDDTGKLVEFAVGNEIPFTVRSGGHDLRGRSQIHDALTIDIRDIKYVEVSQDKSSATIGAGINIGDLVAELQKYGLITPVGNVDSVGYSGWGIYGGYGPYSQNFGLGLDNIIGAKVVTSDGRIIDTDSEPSLLTGIRGAGAAFGVIVEFRIKVYPLKKLLGGLIIFESGDIASTVSTYCRGYQELLSKGLPLELNVNPNVVNTPQGRKFVVQVVWSSDDHSDANEHISRIKSLGSVIADTISPLMPSEMLKASSEPIPTSAYGAARTVSLKSLGDSADAFGKVAESLPSFLGPTIVVHELRGPSAKADESSVFGARYKHFVIEIVALALDATNVQDARKWAETALQVLRHGDKAHSTTYFSLDGSDSLTLRNMLGAGYPGFEKVKRTFDPNNVFGQTFASLLKF